ncbi:MAG: preprotein translocase subunit Sec61beta, partial [Promethearchaeota archaeon]
MAKSRESSRTKRRKKEGPMPMSGAGLIRFFQDSSSGVKIGPIWTVVIGILLVVIVVLAHNDVFKWL